MNILVVGSGGREHAIAWKAAQSPRVNKLYVLPGNAGTAELAMNIGGISAEDHPAVMQLCREKQIDLVIIGPEAPLVAGLADSLSARGIPCFGPKQAAAEIEASKSFAKGFMMRNRILTARYAVFHQLDDAIRYVETVDHSIVIKASGLAAGKGVILPETIQEAKSALKEILLDKIFGEAGDEVVIEERLTGPEISLMAFTDGTCVIPMLPAQDHKRLLDGDNGPNTGGMGAYAPAPVFTSGMLQETVEKILRPAVSGLRNEGRPFVGVLYAGLMLTKDGIRVLEFNCRFGDPETQAVLPLLETDLADIMESCLDGRLGEINIRWKNNSAVCVVMAGREYPEKPENGQIISFGELPDGLVCFHAGTKIDGSRIVTAGGRVVGVTAWAGNIQCAMEKVYSNMGKISFEGMQFRKDIARHALEAGL